MCGIFFYLGNYYTLNELMSEFMRSSHRGPDSSTLRNIESIVGFPATIGFHRLAIMDNSPNGDQPFFYKNGSVESYDIAMCNGEIYNHEVLRRVHNIRTDSGSDCSVIYPLYKKLGLSKLVQRLDGDFGFLIVDSQNHQIHIGRDPVGVKPLFWGFGKNKGELFIASEMKSIHRLCSYVNMVSSGTTITFTIVSNSEIRVHISQYWGVPLELEERIDIDSTRMKYWMTQIKQDLTRAVKKRLMAERPLGLFISGGLDSSLIAGITRKLLGDKPIQSFSIGMCGSPDLAKAQIVADYLGTQHHPVYFTPAEGISVIADVIRQLETYDITTIRASIPQYLLSRYIQKNTDVRVLLSGEGSDELFGGYLYFHRCPSNEEFYNDSSRLIRELEHFDVLRTDRTTAGNGLEVRVPFLDRGFIRTVMSMPASLKNPNVSSGMNKRIEKFILREAFMDETEPIIPDDILWRTKDAFSDACGYDWIPALKTHCETMVSDDEWNNKEKLYPHLTPGTREAFYYRKIFEEMYPGSSELLRHYWLPNWCDMTVAEPSAKTIGLL